MIVLGEELRTYRLVPPLHLPGGGRRSGCGQQMPDPVLGADPVEQHLRAGASRPEPAGEDFPIVSQNLIRDSVPPQRRQQCLAHRLRGGPWHQLRRHREPGVVIDPRHRFQLHPVGEVEAADHIHLPQLHRSGPLPPPIIRPTTPPLPRRSPARCGPAPDRCWSDPAPGRSRPAPAGNRSGLHPRPGALA